MKRIGLTLLAFAAIFSVAQARKVSGSVRCGKSGIENVIVTDGVNFTSTSRSGKFTFDIEDDAEFVYIVTPAGYVADWASGVPAFYLPAQNTRSFRFDLQKTTDSKDYNIVAIADPQAYSDEHFEMFSTEALPDLCNTIKGLKGLSVGLSLGDISWDRIEILDMYKREIPRAGIPFYPVVGNHDYEAYIQGDKEAAVTYRKKMGPENYAFFLGNDLVIVLDNIIYDTNYQMTSGYTDGIIAWVKGLLEMTPATGSVYIAQHVPMGRNGRKINNQDELIEILKDREVTVLSGHTHVNGIWDVTENMTEHNVAAICGAWWETLHCTDGTPRGYKVFTKTSDSLSWYYKPVDFGADYIAEAYGPGSGQLNPDAVIVGVWDWDPCWKVEWSEDGVEKGAMEPAREICPPFPGEIEKAYEGRGEEIPGWKTARPSRHYFAARPSAGAKEVTITVESRFGQKWTKTIRVE